MNVERLFNDEYYLDNEINFFIKKKHLLKIKENKDLVNAHILKARHNLLFYKKNKEDHTFNDWLIISLYYTLYHCALALIINKSYNSKNHYATILILIKEYNITKDEANLINKLSINKDDAQLYTELKNDRHNASYNTKIKFRIEDVNYYEEKVLRFINKTEELIRYI
jgi:uncharacterized protein (UPF0332 family)